MIGTLVVDDDYRVADIHASVVAAQPGFTVCGQAHTAAQARTEIGRSHPDLVLLDLYLPDEHGLDLINELDPAHRPDILVITAARDVATVRRAMQLGTVNYLVKPFSLSHLRERLAAYQDLHQRLHALGTTTETDQEAVDRLYALRSPRLTPTTADLPKRHSAPTMNLITNVVRAAREDMSAAEVAAEVGISRPTAQRYLTYLAERGIVELRLRYGGPGRPEQRYKAADT